MSTISIVLTMIGAGLSLLGFCIGYHVGCKDTRQEILERDPWE